MSELVSKSSLSNRIYMSIKKEDATNDGFNTIKYASITIYIVIDNFCITLPCKICNFYKPVSKFYKCENPINIEISSYIWYILADNRFEISCREVNEEIYISYKDRVNYTSIIYPISKEIAIYLATLFNIEKNQIYEKETIVTNAIYNPLMSICDVDVWIKVVSV